MLSAAAIARSVRSSQEGEGEEQEAREDIRGFRQWTSGMQEDLLVMRNVLVQEDPALDTSSSPPGPRPSRSRSGRRRRRLGGPSPHPWPPTRTTLTLRYIRQVYLIICHFYASISIL